MAAHKFREIIDYIKLEHTVFDLPFIFSGAVIASAGNYDYLKYVLILIAGTSARAAGMSINRIFGRKYDETNPRKSGWSLVKGSLSVRSAIILTVFFAVVFELSTYLLNTFVLLLSPFVFFMFVTDPLMKRVTAWRHIYMGAAIGVGVLGGYLAISPAFPATPQIYLIFIASTFWIAGFDVIYVIPDIEHDREVGLKTVMTKYGTVTGLRISVLMHVISFASMAALAFYVRTIPYMAVLVPILALMIIQHRIVDPSRPETIRASFLGANSFIGLLFLIGMILSNPV